eukprot:8491689-Pyramimonas_sp.AAC.1
MPINSNASYLHRALDKGINVENCNSREEAPVAGPADEGALVEEEPRTSESEACLQAEPTQTTQSSLPDGLNELTRKQYRSVSLTIPVSAVNGQLSPARCEHLTHVCPTIFYNWPVGYRNRWDTLPHSSNARSELKRPTVTEANGL